MTDEKLMLNSRLLTEYVYDISSTYILLKIHSSAKKHIRPFKTKCNAGKNAGRMCRLRKLQSIKVFYKLLNIDSADSHESKTSHV